MSLGIQNFITCDSLILARVSNQFWHVEIATGIFLKFGQNEPCSYKIVLTQKVQHAVHFYSSL